MGCGAHPPPAGPAPPTPEAAPAVFPPPNPDPAGRFGGDAGERVPN